MKVRKKKIREKKQRQEQFRLRKKHRLEGVLSALGLLNGFRELPAAVRGVAIQTLPGRPTVVISPTVQSSPAMEELKDQIEQALDRATLEIEDGKTVPLLDFLTICPALPQGFSSLISAPLSKKQRVFVERAAKISDAFLKEKLDAALKWFGIELTINLMMHSQIDNQVFGCLLEEQRKSPEKPVCQLVLHSSKPRAICVKIDGKVRPAFQCAIPCEANGITWMECDGAVFGLENGRQYPIFIQSHALRRLRERLAASVIAEVTLNLGLMCSLAEPTVVEREDGSYLIDYHLQGDRVGYLVARVAQDKIVITTFLFLTMKGTPECRLLKEKLRLTRRDIEYEGLDRLETFLTPDILADKDLVRVLEECGCGSLLALSRGGFPHKSVDGRAEELKRFLRIPDRGDKKLLKRFSSPRPQIG